MTAGMNTLPVLYLFAWAAWASADPDFEPARRLRALRGDAGG
jgi:hypothetical protein